MYGATTALVTAATRPRRRVAAIMLAAAESGINVGLGLEVYKSIKLTSLALIPFVNELDYSCIHNI